MSWLFGLEDVLLPSVYLRLGLTSSQRVGLVTGRVKEALRIARQTGKKKILPYYWYKYQDQRDTYLNKADLDATLQKIFDLGADGLVVWGSSNDVNSKQNCLQLKEYLDNELGPAVDRIRRTSGAMQYDGEPVENQVKANVDQV